MNYKDELIHRARSPPFASISLALTGIIALFAYLGLQQSTLSLLSFAIPLIVFGLVLSTNTLMSGISITCLQDKFTSVEDQHYCQYWMYKGFAQLDVFVEVPKWVSRFEIRLEPNGPFEISHSTPGDITEKSGESNTLVGYNGPKGFDFKLKLSGDPQELRSSTYDLTFRDGRTGRKIHTIKLHARPDFPNPEDELTEEDAEEWGLGPDEMT